MIENVSIFLLTSMTWLFLWHYIHFYGLYFRLYDQRSGVFAFWSGIANQRCHQPVQRASLLRLVWRSLCSDWTTGSNEAESQSLSGQGKNGNEALGAVWYIEIQQNLLNLACIKTMLLWTCLVCVLYNLFK